MSHEPIKLTSSSRNPEPSYGRSNVPSPKHIDLKKDKGLTIEWSEGESTFYPIDYLRKMSPSADTKALREEMQKNPLTVLPSAPNKEPIVAVDANLVGNYAIRIIFSDGHDTGIFSWEYLKEIEPKA